MYIILYRYILHILYSRPKCYGYPLYIKINLTNKSLTYLLIGISYKVDQDLSKRRFLNF